MTHSLFTQQFNAVNDIGRPLVVNNDGFVSPINVNNSKFILRPQDAIYIGNVTSNTKLINFGTTADNLFFGDGSGGSNTTGSRNTTLGTSSLLSNTTGSFNIAVGLLAGNGNSIGGTPNYQNTTQINNIFIGNYSGANTSVTNSIVIGNLGAVDTSNTVVLGSVSGKNTAGATQSVITGGTSIADTAQLQVDSTNKGFLPPRMTTTQRDNINFPAQGLIIYNITTNNINFFNGTSWVALG